jgi:hypothetical protein
MPSGVMRLRAAREAKAKSAERDAPPAAQRKTLKTSNKSPNPRVGAMGDHEPVKAPLYDPMTHGSFDPSAYAPCCDAGLHVGSTHAGPHTYEMKARQRWTKEQEIAARRASRS